MVDAALLALGAAGYTEILGARTLNIRSRIMEMGADVNEDGRILRLAVVRPRQASHGGGSSRFLTRLRGLWGLAG